MKWRTSGARYASFPGCASLRQPLTKRRKKRKRVELDPQRRWEASALALWDLMMTPIKYPPLPWPGDWFEDNEGDVIQQPVAFRPTAP